MLLAGPLFALLCSQAPAPSVPAEDRAASMTGGGLPADQETALLAEIVRYGVKSAWPTCSNYGWKGGYCLSLKDQTEDPPNALLKLLADVRPPIRSASACRRDGIIDGRGQTTDPKIDVEWLQLRQDGSVATRIHVYCGVSEPVFRRQGTRWIIEREFGWVGCGPAPVDCVTGTK